MADDEKNKVTSHPPPPTETIDDEWGSSGHASAKPPAPAPVEKTAAALGTKTAVGTADAPQTRIEQKAEAAAGRAAAKSEEDDDEEDDDEEDDEEEDGEEAAPGDEDEDEEDDDEEDDDEEDDDEEDDDDAHAGRSATSRNAGVASQDWLPDWAPWATLGGVLALGFLGGVGIIPVNFNLTKATPEVSSAAAVTTPKPSAPQKVVPNGAGAGLPAPPRQPPSAADQERVSASHLLVAYKGALRASPAITRTKAEAKKRAQEALAKAKKGVPFEKLVAEYSDEPGAAARGGKLGTFPRQAMVKPFADAAFALKPGQVSDLVETDFGYHVILRTQ
jgi:parvulin-like peptidyl-prolyl isomerase